MRVAGLVHGVENTPVHRFQSVAQVWNGARYNHTHRIVKIGCLHLVGDRDGRAVVSRTINRIFRFVISIFWRIAHVILPALCYQF